MAISEAKSFRDKAETCRSLARYVTDERTLSVLHEMAAELSIKAQEFERSALPDASALQPAAQPAPQRQFAAD